MSGDNKAKCKFLALLAVLGASSVARTSSAVWNERQGATYPGLFCVEYNATTEPDLLYNNNGAAQNNAGSTRDFECPLVKELGMSGGAPAQTKWDDTVQWGVTVWRSTAAANVAWNVGLWTTNEAGTSGSVSVVTIPTGTGNFVNQSPTSFGFSDWNTLGQLRIYTSVPTGCRIASYYAIRGCPAVEGC